MEKTQEDSVRIRAVIAAGLAVCLFIVIAKSGVSRSDGRQWGFLTDMNGDGRLTVRDVKAIAHWMFFYPGDLVIYGVRTYLQGLAAFFGISAKSYGGMVSLLLSIIGWPLVTFLVYGLTFLPGVIQGQLSSQRKGPN
ncbi:MAG TPA: hypothetical protein VE177_02075, partial [Candidatus Binatus sp.]|nr:hypothetical protein [Candidatus Binatus sp.]